MCDCSNIHGSDDSGTGIRPSYTIRQTGERIQNLKITAVHGCDVDVVALLFKTISRHCHTPVNHKLKTLVLDTWFRQRGCPHFGDLHFGRSSYCVHAMVGLVGQAPR
jgi:hypothetical protein